MIIKKIENFWYYHKVKVFVAVFAIVFILLGSISGPSGEVDLEIGYVIEDRDISLQNQQETTALFESLINGKDGENAEVSFLPLTGERIGLEFAIGISHIILLKKETLEPVINNYFFEPLDYYVDKYNIDISDFPEVLADPKKTNNFQVYALPIKDFELLLDMGFPEDYFFTIRLPNENDSDDVMKNRNAHIVLDYILSYSH